MAAPQSFCPCIPTDRTRIAILNEGEGHTSCDLPKNSLTLSHVFLCGLGLGASPLRVSPRGIRRCRYRNVVYEDVDAHAMQQSVYLMHTKMHARAPAARVAVFCMNFKYTSLDDFLRLNPGDDQHHFLHFNVQEPVCARPLNGHSVEYTLLHDGIHSKAGTRN